MDYPFLKNGFIRKYWDEFKSNNYLEMIFKSANIVFESAKRVFISNHLLQGKLSV